jgi:predicted transcriptional regulator
MKKSVAVADLKKRPVIMVGSLMNVFDALQVAKDHNIHHLVVAERDTVEAIVCTCDLRAARLNASVASVMHRDVATVPPHCSAYEAAQLMLARQVGSVVVTQHHRALGIVTRLDLSAIDASITNLMSHCKCAACGTLQHLRPSSDGEYLCVSCFDRAGNDGWFDLGTGD